MKGEQQGRQLTYRYQESSVAAAEGIAAEGAPSVSSFYAISTAPHAFDLVVSHHIVESIILLITC